MRLDGAFLLSDSTLYHHHHIFLSIRIFFLHESSHPLLCLFVRPVALLSSSLPTSLPFFVRPPNGGIVIIYIPTIGQLLNNDSVSKWCKSIPLVLPV